MAVALRAERRWVMTGTPTPSGGGERAAHLQPLLAFLHHEPYAERKVWEVSHWVCFMNALLLQVQGKGLTAWQSSLSRWCCPWMQGGGIESAALASALIC